jgi:Domain of unknown function (DUF5666)
MITRSLMIRMGILAAGLAAAVCLCADVSSAGVQPANAGRDAGAFAIADPGQPFSISGRIVAVDYATNTIVVRARGDVSIVVTPTTVIERDGQVTGISDLRPGEHVHVSGMTRSGIMSALTIVVK